MPLDYTVHLPGTAIGGQLPPAAHVPIVGGELALAEDTDSAPIVVAQSAVVMMVATAKLRIDVRLAGTVLDPAASPLVVLADERLIIALHRGTYKLRTTLYV